MDTEMYLDDINQKKARVSILISELTSEQRKLSGVKRGIT